MATLNLKKKKFIDEDNLKQIIKIGISFGERLNSIETSLISEYDSTKTYIIGEACYHDNYIYKCNSTATGAWNPDRWQLIGDDITELTLDEIKAMLGLTTEQLTTLSSIILDSEVRLDKTYSSSKIYSSIQDALDTSKAYTLSELGKMSGASYKVVSVTSDMTDERIIYLLDNGTTFDMYIVENETPTKIGDTNIDLSDYYKKTEIDNDFLKKTDATSTYATKIEVNDKVDKTDIVDNLTSTDIDKPLSANQGKALKDEIDKKTEIDDTNVSNKTTYSNEKIENSLNELNDKMVSYNLDEGYRYGTMVYFYGDDRLAGLFHLTPVEARDNNIILDFAVSDFSIYEIEKIKKYGTSLLVYPKNISPTIKPGWLCRIQIKK